MSMDKTTNYIVIGHVSFLCWRGLKKSWIVNMCLFSFPSHYQSHCWQTSARVIVFLALNCCHLQLLVYHLTVINSTCSWLISYWMTSMRNVSLCATYLYNCLKFSV